MSFLSHNTPEEISISTTLASIIGRAASQPLDVIKIRLQLQQYSNQLTDIKSAKYIGVIRSFRIIYKEEGLTALWKGHVSTQLFAVMYNNIFYRSYKFLTDWMDEDFNKIGISEQSFIVGGLSGLVAATATYPLDVIRTRVMIQHSNKTMYRNYFMGFKHVYTTQGLSGFYRGLTPSSLEICIFSGMQFSIFETLQSLTKMTDNSDNALSSLKCFFISGIAGVIPKVILIPLTICKKRMQTTGFELALKHMGESSFYKQTILSWLKNSIKSKNNFRILFAGTSPTIIKSFIVSSLQISIMKLMLDSNCKKLD